MLNASQSHGVLQKRRPASSVAASPSLVKRHAGPRNNAPPRPGRTAVWRTVAVGATSAAQYYAQQPLPHLNPDGSVSTDDSHSHNSGKSVHDTLDGVRNALIMPVKGPTALAQIPDKVQVHVKVDQYVTSYGQVLKVVGAVEELGNWSPDKAPTMQWHEGHSWSLDIELPVGDVHFKVVMQEDGGGTRWEEGQDRYIQVPATVESPAAPGGGQHPVGTVAVACAWGDTQGTSVSVLPDRNNVKRQLHAVEARVAGMWRMRQRIEAQAATRRTLASDSQELPGTSAIASNGTAPASAAGSGPLQVPLLDPSKLPAITVNGSTDDKLGRGGAGDAHAKAAAHFERLLHEVNGSDSRHKDSFEDAVAADSLGLDTAPPDSLSERVLGATVNKLLAAAWEALKQEGAETGPGVMGAEDGVSRAASLLAELEAAALALEKELGLGASHAMEGPALLAGYGVAAMLREAAPQDRVVASIRMTHTQEQQGQQEPRATGQTLHAAPSSSRAAAAESLAHEVPGNGNGAKSPPGRRWLSAVSKVLAAAKSNGDGSLVFSADSLQSVEVDPQEMLMAALQRARSRVAAAPAHT